MEGSTGLQASSQCGGRVDEEPFEFTDAGSKPVSEIFPYLRSKLTRCPSSIPGIRNQNNHSPALFMMNCGFPDGFLRLVLGNLWAGFEQQDLPAFVVMSDPLGGGAQGACRELGSGLLSVWGTYSAEGRSDRQPPVPRSTAFRRRRRQLDLLSN